MQADLICVGNELLTGLIENTNAGYLSRRLWAAGISVREACVVADDEKAIREALERALENSDLAIITGGLGPTEDDLTREAVASILELSLVLDRQWLERMKEFFRARGIVMPENNRKQAMVIEGSITLENRRGTAPGAIIKREDKIIVILPGPPHELQAMFDEQVMPFLTENNSSRLMAVRTLKCIGIGESMLEEKIRDLGRWDFPPISYVSRGYEVDLQIKGSGEGENAPAAIAEAERRLRAELGEYIYGCDDDTLPGLVGEMLAKAGMTLSLAESCSGGLLSDLVTDVPGSSKYFKGGLVAYSADLKNEFLGVSREILAEEGEVSAATARAMAEGAKDRFHTDYAIGITGVAGPESDGSGRPVGLVFIAVAGPGGLKTRELNFGGGRRAVKERSAQIALDMLRRELLELP